MVPSFSIFSSASLTERRMLRIETLASSPLDLANLMYSLRRSSVNCGKLMRIETPSLLGLIPKSDSRSAFSIDDIAPLSKGLMIATRASGTWTEAN